MDTLRWLHLSDIHYNFENYDTLRVRDATLDYLKNRKFDFIVVTGDIAYQNKGYDKGIFEFLNSIKNNCLDTLDNLFIIPGNHDLKRSPLRSNIINGIHLNEDVSRYVTDNMDKETYDTLLGAFDGFFEFYKNIKNIEYPKDKLHFIEKRKKFNIIHINTCLLSGIDKEEGKLVFDQKRLYEVLKEIRGCKGLNVAIGHHTLECFESGEQNLFQNNLSDFNIDIYLSGHVHVPSFNFHQNNINDIHMISSGSGIADGWASAGLIMGCTDLDNGNSSIELHKWSKNQSWIIDNEAFRKAPKGVLNFTLKRFSSYFLKPESSVPKAESTRIRDILFDRSKEYFAMLNGPGGRFCHLDISDIILSDVSKDFIDIDVNVNNQTEIPLKRSLELLWDKDVKHSFIVGEGGMGKTVSLIRLWEEYLKNRSQDTPIPIFVALNEYNEIDEESSKRFIINTIGMDYLGKKHLSQQEENQLWELLKTPAKDGKIGWKPSVILLFDGLNEITKDKSGLLIELNNLIKNGRGSQIIITSRLDMRDTLNLSQFNKLELMGLRDDQINDYCKKLSASMLQGKLLDIVKNPMMLTIYLSTCSIVEINRTKRLYEFKEKVQASGELLWNFIESIALKHSENNGKGYYYKFIIKHLLPYLGWKMEQEGKFYFSHKELKAVINEGCRHLCRSDFFDTFTFFVQHVKSLSLGRLEGIEEIARFSGFKNALVEEMVVMVEENGTYRFLHQNFRDYFAAVHILNEVEMCLSCEGIFPEAVAKSPISYYVGRYMGETEGEHYNVPALDSRNRCWSASHYTDTRLVKLLKMCRGIFDKSIGFTVWNILEIWKNVRGELTGADLSNLDMHNVVLNMVKCSRLYGDKILAASFDGTVLNERNVFPQGHSHDVNSAVYSQDGKRLLSASSDNTIKEWDVLTGECIRIYLGHSEYVNRAVYRQDGKRILSASGDNTIKEWDRLTGECIRTYQGHSDIVNSAVYSQDDKRILSASWDGTIKEWDVLTGECIRTYQGHSGIVNSAVYSQDGKRILSASDDETIKEWDVLTGECIRTYQGHSRGVASVVYSQDSKRILSTSWDGTIKEWDELTGEYIRTYQGHSMAVASVVYSQDGKRILSASSDHSLKEWDIFTGECIRTYQGHSFSVNSAVYSQDGKRILSASSDNTIKEWDALTGECIRTYQGYSSFVTSVVYSQDGKRILSASWDNTIKEWDALTGGYLRTYQGHSHWVNSAVYSQDGKRMLSASEDKTIKEWDESTGECIRTYQGHSGNVNSAVYSQDGKRILSASDDKTIKEWDVLTGECIRTYQGHSGNVNNAVYSQDGKRILSTCWKKTIKEWDRLTGKCIRTYQDHSNFVYSTVYSQDGKRILFALGDNTIKEWDALTGKCIRTYQGHSDDVNSAVYSQDGKRILSASSDNTIKEWDALTGECIRTYQGHSHWVNSAVYSQDGKRILSASRDNTIKEWDTLTGKCIRSMENIPGIMIYGCSFANLHKDSYISEKGMEILKQYGAKEISIDSSDSRKDKG